MPCRAGGRATGHKGQYRRHHPRPYQDDEVRRDAIIQILEATGPSPAQAPAHEDRSGIRLDPKTGKLHLFGSPDPQWLKEQGWAWDQNRHRFMAPYPRDRDDATPEHMIGGGPRLPDDYPEITYAPDSSEDA